MPYTTNKGFSVQATGSNAGTWGSDSTTPTAKSSNALNEGAIQLIDQALGGVTSLSLSNVAVALTQLQTQNAMIRMTGTLTGTVNIGPDTGVLMTGFYCFENLCTGNFSVIVSNGVGTSATLPKARRGIFWIDPSNGTRIISIVGSGSADPIPVGSIMFFAQAAAPAGWTIQGYNDVGLKLVSSGGGVQTGTLPYSTVFGRTSTDSYTLSIAEMPAHTHNENSIITTTTAGNGVTAVGAATTTPHTTGSTGGGGGHSHGIDMRLATLSIIAAYKD